VVTAQHPIDATMQRCDTGRRDHSPFNPLFTLENGITANCAGWYGPCPSSRDRCHTKAEATTALYDQESDDLGKLQRYNV
jgi:hypothetical protein